MTSHLYMPAQQEPDIAQHLNSLKTRLRFARFKLRNGWERNTLLDVEGLWKERQKQMVDDLPVPRFTQQDYLDSKHINKKRLITLTRHSNKQGKSIQMIRPPSSLNTTRYDRMDTSSRQVKSSLDDLSYAIALTERRSTSPHQSSALTMDTDPSSPIQDTAPLSPMQAAAKAMMLIRHCSQDS